MKEGDRVKCIGIFHPFGPWFRAGEHGTIHHVRAGLAERHNGAPIYDVKFDSGGIVGMYHDEIELIDDQDLPE